MPDFPTDAIVFGGRGVNDGDIRIPVANLREAHRFIRKGAKVYIQTQPGGNPDCAVILARSRGGRWVQTYTRTKRLTNFRWATLPPEHPARRGDREWDYCLHEGRSRVDLDFLQRMSDAMTEGLSWNKAHEKVTA